MRASFRAVCQRPSQRRRPIASISPDPVSHHPDSKREVKVRGLPVFFRCTALARLSISRPSVRLPSLPGIRKTSGKTSTSVATFLRGTKKPGTGPGFSISSRFMDQEAPLSQQIPCQCDCAIRSRRVRPQCFARRDANRVRHNNLRVAIRDMRAVAGEDDC